MSKSNVETLAITIGAVETRLGWLGQVMIYDRIVWESEHPERNERQAIEDASYRVTDTLGELLRAPNELEAAIAAEEAAEATA